MPGLLMTSLMHKCVRLAAHMQLVTFVLNARAHVRALGPWTCLAGQHQGLCA